MTANRKRQKPTKPPKRWSRFALNMMMPVTLHEGDEEPAELLGITVDELKRREELTDISCKTQRIQGKKGKDRKQGLCKHVIMTPPSEQ